jgi:membrane-associated phospholipid phosphatase
MDAPEFTELLASLMRRIAPASELAPPSSAPQGPPIDPPREENRVMSEPTSRSHPPLPPFFQRRSALTGLLAGVFLANYIETTAEVALRRNFGLGSETGIRIADAFSALEGHISFESHDLSNWLAVYGYSTSYFLLLPVLGLGLGLALWHRQEVHGYRLLCLAITADYLLSLVFFLFFPVPERWAYPDSGAMLLSDRWSSTLIDLLRPISALDNCFPSTHVSFTVVIVLVAYFCHVRLRHTISAVGMTVVLSTFVLGIHWIPDIVAGLAVGVLSVGVARRLTPFYITAIHPIAATAP